MQSILTGVIAVWNEGPSNSVALDRARKALLNSIDHR